MGQTETFIGEVILTEANRDQQPSSSDKLTVLLLVGLITIIPTIVLIALFSGVMT